MLTSDLVRAREDGEKLLLTKWRGDARRDAVRIAARYIEIAKTQVGAPRDVLEEAFKEVEVRLRLERVGEGLKKLLLDACVFEADAPVDPVTLREAVFTAATAMRRSTSDLGAFDRHAILEGIAAQHGTTVPDLERWLFSDLRSAHRLLEVPTLSGERLVELYDAAQEQAVLLRATRVVVDLFDDRPAVLRALFRKLKFHGVLFSVLATGDATYRLELDGPYSLFTQTTKYGLKLALALPALRSCRRYSLVAHVRWGKTRKPLVFEAEGGTGALEADEPPEASLPEELETLLERFRAGVDTWDADVARDVLVGEGNRVCIPDLVFTHRTTGELVYLEAFGFWRRETLWQRAEMVTNGELTQKVLFIAPAKLRVSESVLPDDLPSALYVYKGTPRATAVRERLDALACRAIEPLPDAPDGAPRKSRQKSK